MVNHRVRTFRRVGYLPDGQKTSPSQAWPSFRPSVDVPISSNFRAGHASRRKTRASDRCPGALVAASLSGRRPCVLLSRNHIG
jgi:hypothetical protein